MKSCIEECLRCYQTCLSTAMGHCLKIGGQHSEPVNLKTDVKRTLQVPVKVKESDRGRNVSTQEVWFLACRFPVPVEAPLYLTKRERTRPERIL
jgi:hypothetical protein